MIFKTPYIKLLSRFILLGIFFTLCLSGQKMNASRFNSGSTNVDDNSKYNWICANEPGSTGKLICDPEGGDADYLHIMCTDGKATGVYRRSCPSGLVFATTVIGEGLCDWPENVIPKCSEI